MSYLGIARETWFALETREWRLATAKAERTPRARYLSLLEGQRIAALAEGGDGVREIVWRLGSPQRGRQWLVAPVLSHGHGPFREPEAPGHREQGLTSACRKYLARPLPP